MWLFHVVEELLLLLIVLVTTVFGDSGSVATLTSKKVLQLLVISSYL